MSKSENSSAFNYCNTCDGKSRDNPQLHEPRIQHILQKKNLVGGLKKEGVTGLWVPRVTEAPNGNAQGSCEASRASLSAKGTERTLHEQLNHLGGSADWMN